MLVSYLGLDFTHSEIGLGAVVRVCGGLTSRSTHPSSTFNIFSTRDYLPPFFVSPDLIRLLSLFPTGATPIPSGLNTSCATYEITLDSTRENLDSPSFLSKWVYGTSALVRQPTAATPTTATTHVSTSRPHASLHARRTTHRTDASLFSMASPFHIWI